MTSNFDGEAENKFPQVTMLDKMHPLNKTPGQKLVIISAVSTTIFESCFKIQNDPLTEGLD